MDNYNRAETIKTYAQKIILGEMEFSDLRETLEHQGLESDEITTVVRLVDNKVLQAAKIEAENDVGKNIFYIGLFLTIMGLILTIGTLTGLIDLNGIGIIAYGPIAGGLIIAMIGKAKMDRK